MTNRTCELTITDSDLEEYDELLSTDEDEETVLEFQSTSQHQDSVDSTEHVDTTRNVTEDSAETGNYDEGNSNALDLINPNAHIDDNILVIASETLASQSSVGIRSSEDAHNENGSTDRK